MVGHIEAWTTVSRGRISKSYRLDNFTTSPTFPGHPVGLRQAKDNGTTTGNASVAANWTRDRGGDGFTSLYHPEDPYIRVATVQYANFA